MIIRTSSAQKIVKRAQRIYPNHAFDQHGAPNFQQQDVLLDKFISDGSDRQKNLIDIVMNNSGGEPAYNQLLLNLLFNNPGSDLKNKISASDKELLLKTWKSANTDGHFGANGIVVTDAITSSDLNSLKAKGLITGSGRSISFTPDGKKVLVEMILDTKSSLRSHATNLNRFIKMCQKMDYPEDQSSVEKFKIVRTPDGKWVAKQDKNISQKPNLQDKTDEELSAMHKQLAKAQRDCFKYREAGSSVWDEKYDLNKLQEFKSYIEAEMGRRKSV